MLEADGVRVRRLFTPLDDGKRSRVTIALELEAHGIARVLAPFILRQARRQLPRNEQKLKELLERGA